MKKIYLLMVALLLPTCALSQQFALKTNVLSDAFLNINIGGEIMLAPKWSLEAEGQFNGWTLSHPRRWKHWAIQPEVRYWLCDAYSGHFFGAHVHGGQYNMGGFDGWYHLFGTDAGKLSESRYQGWFAGLGVSYGYAWILNRHWNLEAEIGLGYSYTKYDKFACKGCGKKTETDKVHHYAGPTRLAFNIVYIF